MEKQFSSFEADREMFAKANANCYFGLELNKINPEKLDELKAMKSEFDYLKETIPKKNDDLEIRKQKNSIFREELITVSNYTVIFLSFDVNNQLAQKELEKRMNNKKINLNEAFSLFQSLMESSKYSTRFISKILNKTYEYCKQQWQIASEDNKQMIKNIYNRPNSNIIAGDTNFFSEVE